MLKHRTEEDKQEDLEKYKFALISLLIGTCCGATVASGRYGLFSTSIAIALIYLLFPHKKPNLRTWNSLNKSQTLFESTAFKVTIFSFGSLALIYLILDTFSYTEIIIHRSIYSTLKEPALIFSLSLPIIALIANHHRSIQTAKQIETNQKSLQSSEGQNIFANFIKHREMFSELIEKDTFSAAGKISLERNQLYRAMYSEALTGDLGTSEEFNKNAKTFRKISEDAFYELNEIKGDWELNKEEIIGNIIKLQNRANDLFSVLMLKNNGSLQLQERSIAAVEELFGLCLGVYNCANFALKSESNDDMMLSMGYLTKIAEKIKAM